MGDVLPFNPWRRLRADDAPDQPVEWPAADLHPGAEILEVRAPREGARDGYCIRPWRWTQTAPPGTHWRKAETSA